MRRIARVAGLRPRVEGDQPKMIGLVVVSHCGVAEEMLCAVELILGHLEGVRAVSMDPRKSLEAMGVELSDAVKAVDSGKGVLILTDLFGGTPANVSFSLLGPNVEILCGVNLPMLIKFAACRGDGSLRKVAETLRDYGRRHITLAGEVLAKPVART